MKLKKAADITAYFGESTFVETTVATEFAGIIKSVDEIKTSKQD